MFVTLMALSMGLIVPQVILQKRDSEILLLIPTLNEEAAIEALLIEAHSVGFSNILVVDGFSSDRTAELAEQAGARVVLQEIGNGKGCGVRSGMKEFLKGAWDTLCIIDGDGTNLPSDLMRLVPHVESDADVVLGSRTRGRREKNAMDTLTIASNLTVSFLLGAKFGRLFTDVQTGYWVFARRAIERIYPKIRSRGFEIEMEIFVKAMKAGLRVRELPVGFRKRIGFTKFSFMLRMRNLYYAFRFLAS